jgi:hypothetical protein
VLRPGVDGEEVIGERKNGDIGAHKVHIPRDAVLTFHLESPLQIGG